MTSDSTKIGTDRHEMAITWLALFAASGTLICCALPITLVTLGLSGAVIALTTNLPFLVTLSYYKAWVFGFSAVLLLFSGWLLYRPGRACPTAPRLAAICNRMQAWNRRVYWFSVIVWMIGFFAAFVAVHLYQALG